MRRLRRAVAISGLVAIVGACTAPSPTPTADVNLVAAPEPAPTSASVAEWSRPQRGDLDMMAARGTIRILVPAGRTSYYIEQGLQHGATFSAGKAFEMYVGRNFSSASGLTVVFLPTPTDDLVTALNTGRGDIAANLEVAPDRDPPQVDIVSAVWGVKEVVATGPDVPKLVSLEDLEGRKIHVRRNSRHYESLALLNRRLAQINKPGCTIVPVNESLTDEDLLALVNDGKIPATLVDSHVAAVWRGVFDKVSVNDDVAVSQDATIGWAVRHDSPKLLEQIQAFAKAGGPGALWGPTRPARW